MWETNGSQGKGRGKNGKKGEAVQGPLGVRSTGVLQVPRVNSQTRECPPPPGFHWPGHQGNQGLENHQRPANWMAMPSRLLTAFGVVPTRVEAQKGQGNLANARLGVIFRKLPRTPASWAPAA